MDCIKPKGLGPCWVQVSWWISKNCKHREFSGHQMVSGSPSLPIRMGLVLNNQGNKGANNLLNQSNSFKI
ncbi:hypothetical protein DsansV1_C26g0192031 [Dioscorea sansibarensis]